MADATPRIHLWHGDHLHLPSADLAQRWVNVLGTATATAQLSWRFADGPWRPLNRGPDGKRLVDSGDFVIELPAVELRPGTQLVEIRGQAVDGTEARRQVHVHLGDASLPALPWDIDCRRTTLASHPLGVQVVDGWWTSTRDGWRTAAPGYDRLLAIGSHRHWQDYRVRVTAAVHSAPDHGSGPFGGFGVLVRWSGHHVDGNQPNGEWRPNGAIGWYRSRWEDSPCTVRNLNLSDAVVQDVQLVGTPPMELQLGAFHVFEMTVRRQPDGPSHYRYRVWPVDEPQRILGDLDTIGRPGEAPTGSVLLICLYVDVTIQRIEVEAP